MLSVWCDHDRDSAGRPAGDSGGSVTSAGFGSSTTAA
jgi:hypothetical protein